MRNGFFYLKVSVFIFETLKVRIMFIIKCLGIAFCSVYTSKVKVTSDITCQSIDAKRGIVTSQKIVATQNGFQ